MTDESIPPDWRDRRGVGRTLEPALYSVAKDEIPSPPPLMLFLGFLWEHLPLYQSAERVT